MKGKERERDREKGKIMGDERRKRLALDSFAAVLESLNFIFIKFFREM